MLRGVNLGPHNRIKMDALRSLYQSLRFEDPRTYIQSGNVIFRTSERDVEAIATKIQDAIQKKFRFRPDVILRTISELEHAVAANPFHGRQDVEPAKLHVTFLAADPGPAGGAATRSLKSYPEELHLKGRELYIYFPDGAGKSKLPWSQVEKLFQTTGTARNWNSVTKMLEIAQEMDRER